MRWATEPNTETEGTSQSPTSLRGVSRNAGDWLQKATVPSGSSCTSSPTYLPALGQHCRLLLHWSLQEHSGMQWFEPICGAHSTARFPFFFPPPVRQKHGINFWAKSLMWQIYSYIKISGSFALLQLNIKIQIIWDTQASQSRRCKGL